MKKIISFIVILVSIFALINNVTVNASSSANINSNDKIIFDNGSSYNDFISEINSDTVLNVIVKFDNLNNMSNYEIPVIFENIYISSNSPYLSFNIFGKDNFSSQYIYLQELMNCIYVDYIEVFKINNNNSTEESDVSNGEDKYTWAQVLKDIGLNNFPYFDSVKIGMIDVGVIDETQNYFQNIDVYTEFFIPDGYDTQGNNKEKKTASNHASSVACLINEILKNVEHRTFYSGQVHHKFFSQSIIYLLDWFKDCNVKIINLSWGLNINTCDQYKRMDELFDYYASSYDMIFIKASGNDGENYVTSPAYGMNLITVGAIDANWDIIDKSNYSETFMKPLVVAPGKDISSINSDNVLYENNNTKLSSGTSYSTAITTGVVALLYLEFPSYLSKIENLLCVISAGAQKLKLSNSSFETDSGFGLINYSNSRMIILNEKVINYDNIYSNQISHNFTINSYTCVDFIIATQVYNKEDIRQLILDSNEMDMNLQLEYIEENGLDSIFIPKIKVKVLKNNELLYEIENCENIINFKIENLFSDAANYQIIVDYLDSIKVPISISSRDYGIYNIDEYEDKHIWKSEKDEIIHETPDNSEEYQCNKCQYFKVEIDKIITDPNENMGCGTEVTLNNGEYGGYEITQGFTRILYLQGDDILSLSRLDYNWTSSNANVAIVSSYGTVTALSVSEPTWVTIIATYKYNNEIIYHKDFLIVPDTSQEFKIYTYDVTMSVEDSYLFKMSYDKSPTISMFDYVWKIPCQKDESAGVQISQWGTITALAPGEMFIEGWSKYNPYIVIQINVVVI